MKNILQICTGLLLGLCIVLLVVVWQSFPFKELYLSDIQDWEVVTWSWAEPLRDVSIGNKSLIINEKTYPKGLAMHANSIIKLYTPPGYTNFVADIGISDEIDDVGPSSVVFLVWGDGVILYKSPVIKADSPAYRVDVNVKWIGELRLEAFDAGDGSNSDHAIWGDARFVRR